MRAFFILLWLLLGGAGLFCPAPAQARPQPESLSLSEAPTQSLSGHLALFQDRQGQLSIHDRTKMAFAPQTGTPNPGFSQDNFWLRFSVHNPTDSVQERLLEVAHANIDWLTLYRPEAGGSYSASKTGRGYPFAQREERHRHFVFKLSLPPQSSQIYYLQSRSTSSYHLDLRLHSADGFLQQERQSQLGFGFYYGLIAAMLFYNLVLWLATRERNYLYYVLTLLTLHGLFQLSYNGLGYEYLWPEAVWWNNHCLGLFLGLSVFLTLHFSQSFLQTRTHTPRLHKVLEGLKWLGGLFGLLNLMPEGTVLSQLSISLSTPNGIVSVLLIWGVALYLLRQGYQPARFFVIAWSSLLLGALVTGFASLGWLPSNFWTTQALQLGTALEVMLLSLAVGDRLRRSQNDLLQAQLERLEQERRAKQSQERLVARLRKLDRLKDDFIANISHELRTPLNGIIGISESMLDGATGQLSQPQQYNLSLVVASARRLFHLVSDLLDFSQLKHREIRLNTRPVWLREVVDVVLKLSQPLVGPKDLRLINAVAADLPPIEADEDRLQQILHNLIGNAIKFTESGQVIVSAEAVRDQLEISVADTGPGIDPRDQERIFASFEQVDGSMTRAHSGSGLGLAITRQLVELHKGRIRVDSQPGEGSRFHFLMPLAHQQSEAAAAETATAPVPTGKDFLMGMAEPDRLSAPAGAGEEVEAPAETEAVEIPLEEADAQTFHILVVDDEPVNLQVLVNMLALQRYTVTRAHSGNEALELLKRQSFDLVLLDVMMPHMSGYEVCEAIRQQYPASELPVVFLTARNQVADLVQGFETGANDYLTKPVSKNELLARIRTHIHLSKINLSYARFVPDEFLRFLGRESILDVQLGDQVQREMTIMFSDIRNFTGLSELLSPKQNFDLLNDYLSRISPTIRIHQGFIDKYLGDGLMALFPSQAQDALDAAMEMLQELALFNQERAEQGFQALQIGVGLHTGLLMLGTIGESERMEGTVISDAVNTAARMEGLTKLYGASLIISDATRAALREPDKYLLRYLGEVKVKGKSQSTGIYEVLEEHLDPCFIQKEKTREAFEQAVKAYFERELEQSRDGFQSVLDQNPADSCAKYYLARCERFLSQGIPADISPTFV